MRSCGRSSTTTPRCRGIYEVVRNAYARRVYVDRAFQKKTNELVQKHIGAIMARSGERNMW